MGKSRLFNSVSEIKNVIILTLLVGMSFTTSSGKKKKLDRKCGKLLCNHLFYFFTAKILSGISALRNVGWDCMPCFGKSQMVTSILAAASLSISRSDKMKRSRPKLP